MTRTILATLIVALGVSACDSENPQDDPPLAEGILAECSVMTNPAQYPRRLLTEYRQIWEMRGEELDSMGWVEGDPIEIVIRYPTIEEQENYETVFGGGRFTIIAVELHNARNESAESLVVPRISRGETRDEILLNLAYYIDAGTGAAIYNAPGGPFDHERQFPPQIMQDVLGRYGEVLQSMEGPFLGECRTR